ncbi:dTMP kinase [Streptomyces liangshanensis]|uniref:dTMP kinase n=1 Tax=Streptomyces liangshanensis TaxID=2717324 RepID=UPI0036D9B2E9
MTRAEQPTVVSPTSDSDALAADSRERAVRSLLRLPPLRRLWGAQLIGGVGDALAVLVLLLLSLQAAISEGSFGAGYRGAAFAVAAVFGARVVATVLFGAVLLGPLTALVTPPSGTRPRTAAGAGEPGGTGASAVAADGSPLPRHASPSGPASASGKRAKPRKQPREGGPLDRRWTMIGADVVRLALLIIAPLWIDWTPDRALPILLGTVFVAGVAERLWTIAKESAAPALLPAPPLEGAAVRPLPDHLDALHRLSLRTAFLAVPAAAAVLLVATLIGNLLGTGIDWFSLHQAALGSYVAAGLFAASVSTLYFIELPDGRTPRPRSPLEGLRRPSASTSAGSRSSAGKGRTGGVPLFVLACSAVAGAVSAAVAVSVLHAKDLGGGPVAFALLVLLLTGGTGLGIRRAAKVLPSLSRRRLLPLAIALTGISLLAMGLVPDTATVLFLALFTGFAAGVAANTGHTLIDLETEESLRTRVTEHLHAVVRLFVAAGVVVAPLLAAAIGPHRLANEDFVFAHGGAAFTLMLVGALLLPVAAVVLAKTDDRAGVPLRRDLRDAVRGGADPAQAPAASGFFLAVEGGDGAGKSTQVEALAEWIRGKGHEVVVTREPGATPVGKRLRSILLDVSSAGLSNRAEALLYAADRAEHVDSVVRPALERGAIVISDRYIDSSVAYQGAGRDLSPTEIARISRWATDGLVPHLTVLLDVSPETARERFTEAPDRLESEPAEFHERVRSGFLTLAAADPARYLVVDAGQEPAAVTTVVRHRLDQMLPLSEAEVKAREDARKAAIEEARRRAEEEAARKAEEERLERERQAQLAKLRAEEEERKRRELEEARQREAERQAEEARQRAEEERRLAEEERRRREAEQQAHEAEQARLRRQAEDEARLRAEAEERRREKQRKAEEALLRAEEARRLAEESAAAAAAASARAAEEEAAAERAAAEQAAAERAAVERAAAEQAAAERAAAERAVAERAAAEKAARQAAEREAAAAREAAEAAARASAEAERPVPPAYPPHETTVPTPVVPSGKFLKKPDLTKPELRKPESGESESGESDSKGPESKGPEAKGPQFAPDEVTQEVPAVRPEGERPGRDSDAEETAVIPQVQEPAADETRVIPRIQDPAADDTAVIPQVRDARDSRGRDAERPKDAEGSGDAAGSGSAQEAPGSHGSHGSQGSQDEPGSSDGRDPRQSWAPPAPSAAPQPRGVRDARDAREVRATDETAVLPPVRPVQDTVPADRVPPGFFREETPDPTAVDGPNERTRELPQLYPDAAQGPVPGYAQAPEAERPRRRSDWAEETPLDDLPTLADELLGPHDDDRDENGGRRRRR